MSQEAYDKAMEELDQLAKSQEEKPEELETIDDLTKALEEELGEDLAKSEEDDEEEDDEGEEPEVEKSQDEDYDDELVKASEAYASLEKSVVEGIGEIGGGMETMSKSIAALMNLNIKQAKVIAGQAKQNEELVKSIQELVKSVQELGGQPVAPNKAVLGVGGHDETPIAKSTSDVRELLIKAVFDKKVDSRWLSLFDSHKTVDIFDAATKQAIGI